MDHSLFYVPSSNTCFGQHNLFEASDSPYCVLWHCLKKLERVSLKDATYYVYGKYYKTKPFSQLGLMKFVQKAENLRWFRSNLTAKNIAILQAERPEITFVS